MRRPAAALLLGLGVALSAAAQPAIPAARLDTAGDRVLARAYVPSAERRVGEVRLVRRGDAEVVQTLLYARILSQVVGEIRRKELSNWPEGRPGHEEAQRYLELLLQAQKQIWERLPRDVVSADRRQKLWIEFVLAPDAQWIAIGGFAMDERGGEVHLTSRDLLASFAPTRHYAALNMRLIAADAFHVEGAELDALLAQLPGLRAATAE